MPRRLLLAAAVASGLCWSGPGQADPPPGAQLILRRGLTEQGLAVSATALQTDPIDCDALAFRGAVLADQAQVDEALPLFAQSEGCGFYEDKGYRYHADALRWAGQGEEAAAVRASHRVVPTQERFFDLGLELGRLEDLRLAQAWGPALDAGELALSVGPSEPQVYAALAELALDMGELDAMLFYLDRMTALGDRGHRQQQVLARVALMEGRPEDAMDHANRAWRQRNRAPEIWALRLEAWRQQGQPRRVLAALDRPRFKHQRHPDLLAVQARALVDLGRGDEALPLLERLEAWHAPLRVTQELRVFLEDAGVTAPAR